MADRRINKSRAEDAEHKSDGMPVSCHESADDAAGTAEVGLDSDIEGADIEALARKSVTAVGSRSICNAPALLQKVKDLSRSAYGSERVPWIETLLVDGVASPKNVRAEDGVSLETTFCQTASAAVREAYRRFRITKVPASRPCASHVESAASDPKPVPLSKRDVEQQRRIMAIEHLKQAKVVKKFLSRGEKKARAKARKRELLAVTSKGANETGNLKGRSMEGDTSEDNRASCTKNDAKGKGKKRKSEESEVGPQVDVKGKGRGTRSERKREAMDRKDVHGKGRDKGAGTSKGKDSDDAHRKKGKASGKDTQTGKGKSKGDGSKKFIDLGKGKGKDKRGSAKVADRHKGRKADRLR